VSEFDDVQLERLKEVALDVRTQFESCYEISKNPRALNNLCHEMSQLLKDAILGNGFPCDCVVGQYLGADGDYEPDTSDWGMEDDNLYDREAGFNHWWIKVGDRIIDICADQFHPSQTQVWRLVMVAATNTDYVQQE
jgi:hypothetical protein